MKKLLLFIILFLPINALAGDINYKMINSTGPYTIWTSAESIPSKGSTYTDTNANTTGQRMTNYSSDLSGSFGMVIEYTFYSASSDNNHFIVQNLANIQAGGKYYLYTTTSATPTLMFSPDDYIAADTGCSYTQPEYRWDTSGNYPNRLYYRAIAQLRYLDISDRTDHLLHDFKTEYPSAHHVMSGDEGAPSEDCNRWAFMICTADSSNGQPNRVICYDKPSDSVISSLAWTDNGLNNVYESKSGKYTIASTNNYTPENAFNNTTIFISTSMSSSNFRTACQMSVHMAPAYDKQGNEVLVLLGGHYSMGGSDNDYADYVMFVRMDTGYAYPLFYQGDLVGNDAGWNYNCQFHAPGLAKKGWCFSNSYELVGDPTEWSYNQLFAFELDETKTVNTNPSNRIWRVAAAQNICNSSYYYNQPNASITNDGTYLYWGNDWRNSTGHMDVFRIQMPTNWYSDLGGTVSVDASSPTTSGWYPAKSATNVVIGSSVAVTISDTGNGVDISQCSLSVGGSTFYSGSYTDNVSTSGSAAAYTIRYVPPSSFAYSTQINVVVNAKDLTSPANTMAKESYSFTTQDAPAQIYRTLWTNH